MSKTAKQILDMVNERIGLPVIDQYFGADNPTGRTLAAIANEALEEFTQLELSKLRKEGTFTMTTAESYTLPSDFRYIVPDTIQVQDQERYIEFPQNSSDWYYFKSKTTASEFNYRMRIADGEIQVDNPQSGEVVIYEYLTNLLVTASGGSTPDKAEFTKDSDVFLLDAGLMVRFVSYMYKMRKGIKGWQNDQQVYEKYKNAHFGLESGAKTLDFCDREYVDFPYFNTWVDT
jgi:hypothetical protein